ncbi:Seh1p KNAG_0F02280 [Huiozyma naganishii CBS 8797]|uniref:Uncharacterized protein n=1 Tax=Huiozyma naganishii (strain ATCC MYA-139 / BCRC 22969 / CBS 8797 / KCTC 17520 / NBRC 10181 / NCYC 3082 / Yp74L-3) TaxID=1071383 RepID=J7RMV0_HUIN7|nr:hypothetical protein KNAG_0F02280 [Kazachstania naganishii CBS 8797]CCK70893.1 hypothetical protein KNAG_0F02280 [Kazachstania naganishii CBS 8797]
MSLKPFDSGHEDLVHDVVYDFYGRFVATCSSDQHVKVFKCDKDTNEWELSDSWKAHDSSIVSLDWASPEYGRIIVTASYDKTVKVWEENPDQDELSGRRWSKLATLNDSQGALYSVKFAPAHLGLKFACIGNDGLLRIYDALEPSDLRSWTLTSEIKVLPAPPANHLQSDFCLAWCPSRFSAEKLAVCALDQALIYQRGKDNKLHIAARLKGHRGLIRSISWAPSIGRWYQLVATGSKDGKVRIFKITEKLPSDTSGIQQIEPSTNTEQSLSPDFADSSPDNSSDVPAFVPSKQLSSVLNIELLSEHDDHKSEVWSVSWNLTGTILSSAGDDGKVRLWKSTYSNEFKCMSVITAQQ